MNQMFNVPNGCQPLEIFIDLQKHFQNMHMHMNHFKEVRFPNDSKWMHPNGF